MRAGWQQGNAVKATPPGQSHSSSVARQPLSLSLSLLLEVRALSFAQQPLEQDAEGCVSWPTKSLAAIPSEYARSVPECGANSEIWMPVGAAWRLFFPRCEASGGRAWNFSIFSPVVRSEIYVFFLPAFPFLARVLSGLCAAFVDTDIFHILILTWVLVCES